MKTVITSLPIYNKIEKQCYERSKHATNNALIPIICPRHRLPSFQWIDDTDGAASISKIELLGAAEEIVATNWISHTFDTTFTHIGLEIASAVNGAGNFSAYSSQFATKIGTEIEIDGNLTMVSAPGTEPGVVLLDMGFGTAMASGANTIQLTSVSERADNQLYIYGTGVTNFALSGVTIKKVGVEITNWFVSAPALAHDYFSYNGDTLKYLMDPGEYYLKITTDNGAIYYSEWFKVDCVYENLISSLNSDTLQTFITNGTQVISAINTTANLEWAYSVQQFSVFKGETIKVYLSYIKNSGAHNIIELYSNSLGTISNTVQLGNSVEYTLIATGAADDVFLLINSPDATDYSITEILVCKVFSDKYLSITFSNVCDLGNIYYHGGFDQTIWFESEPMETSFPMEEDGAKNGEGRFVRSFARQEKKYIARTMRMPDYMVDVFNRMRLHDTIELIDLVGNENYVYNLEVDHEWMDDDKYYARITLTFDYDEAVVVGGCCNNIS